jgi:ribokinase
MKKQIKILTIGGATQDIFLHYNNLDSISLPKNGENKNYLLLEEGAKIDLKKLNYYSGGGATNSAVSFKRLGFDVSAIFKLGKDAQADFILNDLKKENIDVSNVAYSDSLFTAISFIFPCPSGDRVVLAYRGANKELEIQDFSLEIIKKYDVVYITSLNTSPAKLLFEVTHYARKNNILVAINPGMNQLTTHTDEFKTALKNVDILTLNRSEAKGFFSLLQNTQFTIESFFKEVSLLGPKVIAVTDGSQGVYVFCDNTIYFHPSIEPEKLVNTLGAGDAFGSCFVANLLYNKSIEEALIAGILNSSSVISKEGAKSGLLTLEQLEQKIKTIKTQLAKTEL